MSQAYSGYTSSWWKDYKFWLKNIKKTSLVSAETLKEYRDYMLFLYKENKLDSEDIKTQKCFSTNMILFSISKSKFEQVDHFFVENGLSSFFINSVNCIEPEYFRPFVCDGDGFFIHFPSSENTKSLFVAPISSNVYAATNGDRVFLLDQCVKNGDAIKNLTKEMTDTVKLVMGFSLYIDAFPDVVREADNIKHVGHYKGHRHSVRANDIVRTEATHSVSPHFRRGHFRLLQSEKFKAKRGQAIFIKGCFVKGHAFDVLADDGKSVGGVV